MNKLFMVLLGCKPDGRNTEQHDVFFGVGATLRDLVPQMSAFWHADDLHVDAWTCVERIDGHRVDVATPAEATATQLYFVNLGGYVPGKFDELHEKLLIVAGSLNEAKARSRDTEFFRSGQHLDVDARSHLDDKAAAIELVFEEDETFAVGDKLGSRYALLLVPEDGPPSAPNVGYLALSKLL